MQTDDKDQNPLPLNPALQNRRTDITLDRQSLKRNGLAQRISSLIAATMSAGASYGTGTPPDPDHITCRLYLVKTGAPTDAPTRASSGAPTDPQTAIHLEITYKDSQSGTVKPFEKFGSRHNLIGTIADGKIGFSERFIDDHPLTPDQRQYFEATLKPLV